MGIEENAKFFWGRGITAAASHARIVSGTPITAGCRAIRDGHELELMQRASNATLKVYEATYRALQPNSAEGISAGQSLVLYVTPGDHVAPRGRIGRFAR